MICIENIDLISEDKEESKYNCRVHEGTIYIDHTYWNDDNAIAPVCDKSFNGDKAIKELVKKVSRDKIIQHINGYGDAINWEGWTSEQILAECWQSDQFAGEAQDGIVYALWVETV